MIVRPLGPVLGAEVEGVALDRPTPALLEALAAAWRRHLVLVVRDQALDPPALLRLVRALGVPDLAPPLDQARSAVSGLPEIAVVSNIVEDGVAIGGLGHGDLAWHSDMTFRPVPPAACVLHAVELPAAGGDTWFLSLAAAWERLAPDVRVQLEGLRARHGNRYTSAGTPRRTAADDPPGADHPVCMVDPLSGRPCLFLGRRLEGRLLGLPDDAAAALLDRLWRGLDDPALAIRHAWRLGDVALWSNIATMHRRDAFAGDSRRLLWRGQIAALDPAWCAAAATAPPA